MNTDVQMLINFHEMKSKTLKLLFPRNESPGRILANRQIFKDPEIYQFISSCNNLNLNQKHRFEVIPQSRESKWQSSHSILISYRNEAIETAKKMEVSIQRGIEKIIRALNVLPIGIGVYIPENSLQIYGFDLPKEVSKDFLNHIHWLLDPEYETYKNTTSLEEFMLNQKLFPAENSPGAILQHREKIKNLAELHKDLMPRNEPLIGGEIQFQNSTPMIYLFTTPKNKVSEIAQNNSGTPRSLKDGLKYLVENNKLPFEIYIEEGRAFLKYKYIQLNGHEGIISSFKEEFNL